MSTRPTTLEYAPPRRRAVPWRRVAVVVSLALATLAAAVIVPRALRRAEQLRAQRVLMERAYPTAPTGRPGDPRRVRAAELATFARWAGAGPSRAIQYAGGHDAGAGGRLVLVDTAMLGRQAVVTAWVAVPGGWLDPPRVGSSTEVIPLDVSTAVPGIGRPVPGEPAMFEVPVWVGRGREMTRWRLLGRLQANDRVRWDLAPAPPPAPPQSGVERHRPGELGVK